MWLICHPLAAQDLTALVEHILGGTGGNVAAAKRHLDEIEAMLRNISGNPLSEARLAPPLGDWLVRHSGRGQRVSGRCEPKGALHRLGCLWRAGLGEKAWVQ